MKINKTLNWTEKRAEILVLAIWGVLWGLGYGAIMNLWSWPFIAGTPDQYWQPGITWKDTFNRYAAFYLATSLVWDLGRSAGNLLFLGLFGGGVIRTLRRFRKRFEVSFSGEG